MLDFLASEGVDLASEGGPGQRRWTWPAEVDLAAGEAEGKECPLLSKAHPLNTIFF